MRKQLFFNSPNSLPFLSLFLINHNNSDEASSSYNSLEESKDEEEDIIRAIEESLKPSNLTYDRSFPLSYKYQNTSIDPFCFHSLSSTLYWNKKTLTFNLLFENLYFSWLNDIEVDTILIKTKSSHVY